MFWGVMMLKEASGYAVAKVAGHLVFALWSFHLNS